MNYELIITPASPATNIMSIDASLLSSLEHNPRPILHLYDWKQDAATYGHFIDPQKFLDLCKAKELELDLAKRPTGGGIIFHTADLAFSFLFPSTLPDFSLRPLDNYAYVNNQVSLAIRNFLGEKSPRATLLPEEPVALDEASKNFCMAKPTKYDVMLEGKKVGGAAQRKTRFGYLHQGSICLGLLSQTYLNQILLPGTQVAAAMAQNTFAPLGKDYSKNTLAEARKALRQQLIEVFKP